MYRLLNLRIDPNHGVVDVPVVPHEDLGVPRRGDEDGVDAARDGRREDVCDLQADEEGEEHDDSRPAAVAVVLGLREEEVEVREEGAGVGDEQTTKGQDGADEAFLKLGLAKEQEPRFEGVGKGRSWLTLIRASMPRSLIMVHVPLAASKYDLPKSAMYEKA